MHEPMINDKQGDRGSRLQKQVLIATIILIYLNDDFNNDTSINTKSTQKCKARTFLMFLVF